MPDSAYIILKNLTQIGKIEMKVCHPKSIILALLSGLLLISCWCCGLETLTAGGGIGGTGIISQGVITAFGSVVVNGTEFDTSNAAIMVGGEEIGIGDDIVLDNLDIGMVVTVEGMGGKDGAIANRVIYSNNVEGPIESIGEIDPVTKEIVVLGQTVIVNVITEIRGVTFETMALNNVVKVSGFPDDTGAVWATFLEKTGEFIPGLVVEVQGFVVNLDTNMETFEINDLTIDYSFADISALPGGVPADGLLVEVEGTLDAAGGEMLATEIEPGDEVGDKDVYQIEVMGFVTDFVSVFEFTVGNQVVKTDEATEFVDGTPEDIRRGVKIEAEGSLVEGVLFADEIEFWEPDQIELENFVTDFVSVFEFTVGDQVVHTDENTVFEGGIPDDIALGVMIEIKGRMAGDILVADKVSFEEE